jgi:hypothetical protein
MVLTRKEHVGKEKHIGQTYWNLVRWLENIGGKLGRASNHL